MPREWTVTRRVSFVETDLAGVMHFSNYLRWMEDAEHAFWRSLGRSVHITNGSSPVSWPRASVTCDYLAPVRFEDELELRFRITRIGKRSMQYEVDFRKSDERVALGKTTTVCCTINHGRFESIDIPQDVRDLLES